MYDKRCKAYKYMLMFEMIMMIDGCIYAFILLMGRWITFGWLDNNGATFGKMHTVEGALCGLWHFS